MFASCFMFASLLTVLVAAPSKPEDGGSRRYARSPWRESFLKWINLPRHDEQRSQPNVFNPVGERGRYNAMTFGDGHVVTFDGMYYNIPDGIGAACPHILSRDQHGLKFMVLRNSNSITLYTTQTVITLHNNNKVEVNNTGTYRDLPVQSWNSNVAVTHDNEVVAIQTKTGVVIECDLQHTECVVGLTESFHNHTTGLLGTNDGDRSNELLLPSGRVAFEIQEFINYYELSGASVCRPQPSAGRRCTSDLTRRCQRLFRDPSSQIAACHTKVDPEPFMLACMHDMERCGLRHKDRKMCDAVRAYVRMCKTYGMDVLPPVECNRCDNHHKMGSAWKEKTHKKLDVVMATSLSKHFLAINASIGSLIHDTFHHVIRVLKTKARMHNVRVGLLGFGGAEQLNQPHVYTVQGESFTRLYSSAIWRDTTGSLESDGIWRSNPIIGLKSALKYPFRPDAVKMILLFSEQVSNADQNIGALTSKLQAEGVILNVITTSEPEFYNTGIRGVHINQDISELVETSHGSVFDVEHLVSSDNEEMQHLGQTVTDQVMQNVLRCRECTCRAVSGAINSICKVIPCV